MCSALRLHVGVELADPMNVSEDIHKARCFLSLVLVHFFYFLLKIFFLVFAFFFFFFTGPNFDRPGYSR